MKTIYQKISKYIFFYIFATLLAILFIAPPIFMLSTSFQSQKDIYKLPPKWIPRNITLSNYQLLFKDFPIGMWAYNTMFYTVFNLILELSVCSLAAFAFSRMKFFAKNTLFILILSTIMIPFETRIIPLYLVL